MTSLAVVVAAYGSLEAAIADWDDADATPAARNLIDAALIERADQRIVILHRFSGSGWGQGVVASAVAGVLWPPALLDGAIAGGVGRRTLTLVSQSLSRDAANELGRVMESGQFVTLGVVERGADPTPMGVYGARCLRLGTLPILGTAFELRAAVRGDEVDDR